MIKLVLVRHGKTIWNLENRYTGWTDVELSEEGIMEAKNAGKLLKEKGFSFDLAYDTGLKRSALSLELVLKEMGLENIEIRKSNMLNERHYGALQGLNKDETRKTYGEEQVRLWRRSYDVRPPLLTKDDPRYVEGEPLGESLKDTSVRVVKYYEEEIKKELLNGRKIIISAHGNSTRALIKYLDNISDEDIMNLEIEFGVPIIYEFDDNLNVIRHYYLGDKND